MQQQQQFQAPSLQTSTNSPSQISAQSTGGASAKQGLTLTQEAIKPPASQGDLTNAVNSLLNGSKDLTNSEMCRLLCRFESHDILQALKRILPANSYHESKASSQGLVDIIKILKSELRLLSNTLDLHSKANAGANNIWKAIKRLALAEDKLKDRLSKHDEIFEEDLDTPYALKDKRCDQITESILELYGHKNAGEYLSDRRNQLYSRWENTFVPKEVKEIVKFRRTASDSWLDAEKVRPYLRKAIQSMIDQMNIEEKIDGSEGIFNGKPFNQEDAKALLELWKDEDGLPRLLRRLRKILGQGDLLSSAELDEVMSTTESFLKLSRDISGYSDEVNNALSFYTERRKAEAICEDPGRVFRARNYFEAKNIIKEAFNKCTAVEWNLCFHALEREINSIKWYHLFSLRRKWNMQELLKDLFAGVS